MKGLVDQYLEAMSMWISYGNLQKYFLKKCKFEKRSLKKKT